MKKTTQIPLITLALGVALLTGCGQQQPDASGTDTPAPGTNPLQSAIEAARPAAEQALQTATDAASAAVADATGRANSLIEQAKSLVARSQFADALSTLQQLGSLKLTPEQEKLVTSLREQIQRALAGRPATNAPAIGGGLLGN